MRIEIWTLTRRIHDIFILEVKAPMTTAMTVRYIGKLVDSLATSRRDAPFHRSRYATQYDYENRNK